jgi:hypothetical protein
MLTLLAPLLLPLPAPQDGWTVLPLPAVSLSAPASPAPRAIDDGRHLRLADEPPAARPSEPALDPGLALQLLEEDARQRGAALRLRGGIGVLLAQGDPAEAARLRPALAALEELDRRLAIELEVALTPAGGAPRVERRTVRSGATAAFGERVQESFLGGWSVEVATESGVADPLLGSMSTGELLHLVPTRLGGAGEVHLSGLLDLAQGSAPDDFDPDSPDLGVVQQPRVRFAQVAFSGVVASGGALAVTLTGLPLEPPDWTLTVTARALADPDPAPADGWMALDLAALAEPRGALPPHGPGFGLERAEALPPAFEPGLAPLSPASVATMLDGAAQFPRPPLWTQRLLFVPSEDPTATAAARALVEALAGTRRPTTELCLARGPLSVTFPTAAGSAARVLVGEERLLVVDYDVELAPHTWMGEPRVERAFDGVSLEGACDGRVFRGAVWSARTLEQGVLEEAQAGLGRMQWVRRALRGDVVRRALPLDDVQLLPADGASAALTLRATSR